MLSETRLQIHKFINRIIENPDYCPEILTGPKAAAIEIIGKVVWWGHTSKE